MSSAAEAAYQRLAANPTFHPQMRFSGTTISEQVRQRQHPVIDPATGVFSFIHVEDAASATVAALEIRPGVYNIVDNDPVALAIWLPAFANFIGAPAPPQRGFLW